MKSPAARPSVTPAFLRRRLGGAAVVLLTVQVTAGASPAQEEPPQDTGGGDGLIIDVDIDIDVSLENHEEIGDTLDDLTDSVDAQLEVYDDAQAELQDAVDDLAEVELEIVNLELLLEGLTEESDAVVTAAYVHPPSAGAVDLLTTESVGDLALKQALLGLLAEHDGDVLGALATAQDDMDDQLDEKEDLRTVASAAQGDAAQALEDLDTAMSREAQFILSVYGAIGEEGEIDPDFATEASDLFDRMTQIEADTEAEREQRRIEEEAQERANNGFSCPVQPIEAVNFTDTWGAPRSGGRTHKGTDMFAAHGTATVAPVSGTVTHRGTSLGGLSWYVYGDDGHTYYGTHLGGYEKQGVGRVAAGDIIGYVGSSGNASASAPHLHFEYHENGGAPVNPYPLLDAACPGH